MAARRQVIWTAPALDELDEIAAYIAASPGTSRKAQIEYASTLTRVKLSAPYPTEYARPSGRTPACAAAVHAVSPESPKSFMRCLLIRSPVAAA